FASPRELAEEVERWLADEPVRAYREPLAPRLGRWLRRHQRLAAGTAALLLTGVVALAVSTALIGRAQRDTADALKKEEEARRAADAERGKAFAALRQSRLTSANLALERGLTLCDAGDAGTGIHWFVRGLELAPEDEAPLRDVLLAN